MYGGVYLDGGRLHGNGWIRGGVIYGGRDSDIEGDIDGGGDGFRDVGRGGGAEGTRGNGERYGRLMHTGISIT